LFQGRKLKYPWKVKEVRIIRQSKSGTDIISSTADDDAAVNYIRKPNGDSLYFTFTVESTPLYAKDSFPVLDQKPTPQTASYEIYKFEYILLGPIGVNIFDAFD
jgi:hypothetical protein